MKQFFIVLTVLVFSCTQEATPPSSDQQIFFDVGAKHYSYKGQAPNANLEVGVYAWKDESVNVNYEFIGFNNMDDYIHILIFADSLQEDTYMSYPVAGVQMVIDGESYSSVGITDSFIVEITGYKNGIVNASFHGLASSDRSISDPNHKPPVLITEGVVKNAVMHY